jgi:hypothetical protein
MSTDTRSLIGDREKLRDAEERIRATIVALADYLTDREDYDVPHAVIEALCPADVGPGLREACFEGVLRGVVRRRPDLSRPLPHEAEIDLNYMTGAWRR